MKPETNSPPIASEPDLRMPAAWMVMVACLLPVLLQFALHGYSSGHDLPFHLGSWQDAARQLRRGVYPQWDSSAALALGEPRFVFYPPISWLLGGALSEFLTPAHASEAFTLIALALCWLTMYRTALAYMGGAAALLAAATYALGPYTLYNALERGAYGELLACAWLPLLFGAMVPAGGTRRLPGVREVARPMALLWLTNVPTAIIGSYLLLLLGLWRLSRGASTAVEFKRTAFVWRTAGGALLGILLCAFFLIPAVHQSSFVQLNRAFADGQTYADNFLLHHTVHTRRGNLHVVSVIAAIYIATLCPLLVLLLIRVRRQLGSRLLLEALGLLGAATLFLLLPLSAAVWRLLPELSVLQFPWRWLCVLSLITSFALGSALESLVRVRAGLIAASLALAWVAGGIGAHRYWLDPHRVEVDGRLRSDDAFDEQRRPTAEYTPAQAQNDALRNWRPTYWVVPNAEDDAPLSMVLQNPDLRLPQRFTVKLQQPEFVVLKLRNYPSWTALVNGQATASVARADGRVALPLPAGSDTVELRWHRGPDTWLGLVVSFMVLMLLLLVPTRIRQFTRA